MKNLIIKLLKSKIIKFGIVGSLGALTNLFIFFIFVDIMILNPTLISITGFLIAVTQNYIINHIWTFQTEMNESKTSYNGWLKFVLSSLLGLCVNIGVLNLIISTLNPQYKVIAQGIGILSGMFFNFIGSKYFVFKKN